MARDRPESEGRRVSEAVPLAAFQLGCSSSARAWSIWSYAYVDDLGGGHQFALAGERFVGLIAEDLAQVSDRRVDLSGER